MEVPFRSESRCFELCDSRLSPKIKYSVAVERRLERTFLTAGGALALRGVTRARVEPLDRGQVHCHFAALGQVDQVLLAGISQTEIGGGKLAMRRHRSEIHPPRVTQRIAQIATEQLEFRIEAIPQNGAVIQVHENGIVPTQEAAQTQA